MSRIIDADALVEELRDLYKRQNWHNKEVHFSLEDMEGNILSMPVIEERRTGRWIQESLFTKPRCSECGESCFGLHGFDYTKTSFCPNCGAMMEGEDDEQAD